MAHTSLCYLSLFSTRWNTNGEIHKNILCQGLTSKVIVKRCQQSQHQNISRHLLQNLSQCNSSLRASMLHESNSQMFSLGMIENLTSIFWSFFSPEFYHLSQPPVATVARNCLIYSISKLESWWINLEFISIPLGLSWVNTQISASTTNTVATIAKLCMIQNSDKKHPECFAVDTTAPLPNFCVHSII